jgi:hypothetical protein
MVGRVRVAVYATLVAATLVGARAWSLETVAAAFNFPADRVWMHRRDHSDLAIEAVAKGFEGIELDIFLVDGALRVAHDEGELPASQSLVQYLDALDKAGAKPHLWLDLKNLSFRNETDVRNRLLELIDTHDLADRLLVESPNPLRMFRLCQGIIRCSVWVQHSDSIMLRNWARIMVRSLAHSANLAAISIDYRLSDNAWRIVPDGFPVLLYTFPAGSDLSHYLSDQKFRILLTD